MARLQKIKHAGYKVISNWGCEFKKILRENPGLENESSSYLILGTLQLIFGMRYMEVELKQSRCGTKSSRVRKSIMLM
jgi:hypothetical protein